MKYLLTIFFLSIFIFANNLEISSDNFYYKDGEKKAQFSGHVIAKNGDNIIKASKVTVYLDDNSEAKKYIASGGVRFEIKNPKHYIKGSCYTLIYLPIEDRYILRGKVALKDILNKREIFGDEIIVDNKKGESYAKSHSKKPVKFIFKIKSK